MKSKEEWGGDWAGAESVLIRTRRTRGKRDLADERKRGHRGLGLSRSHYFQFT